LSVQPHDCLVGDSCIIVQFKSLVENSCLVGAGNKVRCAVCQYELGRLISSGVVICDKQFLLEDMFING